MSNDRDAMKDSLKTTMNPKNRGNYAELRDIEVNNLTDREKVLLRIINELENQLDSNNKDGAQ